MKPLSSAEGRPGQQYPKPLTTPFLVVAVPLPARCWVPSRGCPPGGAGSRPGLLPAQPCSPGKLPTLLLQALLLPPGSSLQLSCRIPTPAPGGRCHPRSHGVTSPLTCPGGSSSPLPAGGALLTHSSPLPPALTSSQDSGGQWLALAGGRWMLGQVPRPALLQHLQTTRQRQVLAPGRPKAGLQTVGVSS